jgi:hypothetical protein
MPWGKGGSHEEINFLFGFSYFGTYFFRTGKRCAAVG